MDVHFDLRIHQIYVHKRKKNFIFTFFWMKFFDLFCFVLSGTTKPFLCPPWSHTHQASLIRCSSNSTILKNKLLLCQQFNWIKMIKKITFENLLTIFMSNNNRYIHEEWIFTGCLLTQKLRGNLNCRHWIFFQRIFFKAYYEEETKYQRTSQYPNRIRYALLTKTIWNLNRPPNDCTVYICCFAFENTCFSINGSVWSISQKVICWSFCILSYLKYIHILFRSVFFTSSGIPLPIT